MKATDHKPHTPLHIAASHGKEQVVILLFKHSANVNAKDEAGETAVQNAVSGGHSEVL
jgi:ankyrin repeat protein